jgi:hypothetical protein
MGLLRWLRGGDDNDSSVAAMSAGLAELEGFVQPARRKQTELIQEQENMREDIGNGMQMDRIDLESGVAVIYRRKTSTLEKLDEAEDRRGDELDGDRRQKKARDAGQDLDAAPLDDPDDH